METIMTELGVSTVQKLIILRYLAENKELKLLSKIMIEYISDNEKGEAGFAGKNKNGSAN